MKYVLLGSEIEQANLVVRMGAFSVIYILEGEFKAFLVS